MQMTKRFSAALVLLIAAVSLNSMADAVVIPTLMPDEIPVVRAGGAGTIKSIPDRTTAKEFEVLIVFVDFSDAPGKPEAATEEYFKQVVSKRLFGKNNEMQRWFYKTSMGKVRMKVRVVPGWQRVSRSEEFYNTKVNGAWNWQTFVHDVPEAVFKTGVRLKSNTIVYTLLPASAGKVCSPFNIGGCCHAFNYKLPYEGGPHAFVHFSADFVRDDSDVSDLNLTDFSCTLHETLHWFGLPDLYPTAAPYNHEVGPWDIMAMCGNAKGILGWNLHLLRWLDDSRKKFVYSTEGKAQVFKLKPLSAEAGLFMLAIPENAKMPSDPDGFWLVELNQGVQAVSLDGRDRKTNMIRNEGSGVLIYRMRPGYAGGRVLKVYHRDFHEGKPFAKDLANNSLYEEGDMFSHPDAPMTVKVLKIDPEGAEIELTVK